MPYADCVKNKKQKTFAFPWQRSTKSEMSTMFTLAPNKEKNISGIIFYVSC